MVVQDVVYPSARNRVDSMITVVVGTTLFVCDPIVLVATVIVVEENILIID